MNDSVKEFKAPKVVKRGSWTHRFAQMHVGDYMVMNAGATIQSMSVAAHRAGKSLGRKFACRTGVDGRIRIYRVE